MFSYGISIETYTLFSLSLSTLTDMLRPLLNETPHRYIESEKLSSVYQLSIRRVIWIIIRRIIVIETATSSYANPSYLTALLP